MNQQVIRQYNNQIYSILEGSQLISELNLRTRHNVDGYNSIEEIGTKLKALKDDIDSGTYVYSMQIAANLLTFTRGSQIIYSKDLSNYDGIDLLTSENVDGSGSSVIQASSYQLVTYNRELAFEYQPATQQTVIKIADEFKQGLFAAIGVKQNSIISGGYYNIPGTYQYFVWADVFTIDGILYNQYISAIVTLPVADATNDRFDTIVIDNTLAILSLNGDPSPNPTTPQINSQTQVQVTTVRVSANTTAPIGVTTYKVYDENLQAAGGEWNTFTNQPSIDLQSVGQTTSGVTSIEFIQAGIGASVVLTNPNQVFQGTLMSLIKLDVWLTQQSQNILDVVLKDPVTLINTGVSIQDGQFGFDQSKIDQWQTIIIPASAFSSIATVQYDEIEIINQTANASLFVDNIIIQQGINPITLNISQYSISIQGNQLQLLKDNVVDSFIELPASSRWDLTVNTYNLRLPTETEFNNERLSWITNNSAGAFSSPLKLTVGGERAAATGLPNLINSYGYYWTSTISSTSSRRLGFYSVGAFMTTTVRAAGNSVRLILDGDFTQLQFDNDYSALTIEIDGLTYGFCYNPSTQKIWLDRNLGATQVALTFNDSSAYGWLFQWGRSADGHQISTSLLLDEQASFYQVGHGYFITNPNNWLTPSNDNLWQGTNGLNNPGFLEKLIGKSDKKADYRDLLNKPYIPQIPITTYSQTFGDEILTEFTINHNLNSDNVLVEIRETLNNKQIIDTVVRVTDQNNVLLIFSTPPFNNQYTVTIKI